MGSALHKLEESKINTLREERRRDARFHLGLPVGVQLAGRPRPITVELLDLSARGGRFRCLEERVRVAEAASVVFLLEDQSRCVAQGQVVRCGPNGEFALRLDGSNDAFLAFVSTLED
jgi:hypothetical protein